MPELSVKEPTLPLIRLVPRSSIEPLITEKFIVCSKIPPVFKYVCVVPPSKFISTLPDPESVTCIVPPAISKSLLKFITTVPVSRSVTCTAPLDNSKSPVKFIIPVPDPNTEINPPETVRSPPTFHVPIVAGLSSSCRIILPPETVTFPATESVELALPVTMQKLPPVK